MEPAAASAPARPRVKKGIGCAVSSLVIFVRKRLLCKSQFAEFWYAIDYCEDRIVRLREAWIDPFLAGNIWLVRGSERDLLIDTGTCGYQKFHRERNLSSIEHR
jgi:hypothetical protein